MGTRSWLGYMAAAAAVGACTAVGLAISPRFDLVNVAMLYLLGVVIVSLRHPGRPAVLTAILSVATFDFLFVPPQGTFSVDDAQYLLAFAIMLGVALVISRLVDSVRTQAHAQAASEAEAETERIRNVLLASISHDLRTPLAVMTGASSTLVERGEDMSAEERRELARSMLREAQDMSEHVAKVLQMARLQTSAVQVTRDWASIAEIAGVVLSRLRDRLAAHRVVVEIADDLPLVRIDASLVEQALGNLLENAARHTPAGTVVRVKAAVREGEMVVTVEDYAGGLAPDDMERVFGKFDRGAAEQTAAGMGLGLAICRAIVRLHGGRTWAHRVAAGGTAFCFTLPLEAHAPMLPAEAPA